MTLMLLLSGCLRFRPVVDSSRSFLLSAGFADEASRGPAPIGFAVGVGRVEVAEYLQPRRLALRKGMNEIQYLDDRQWAERLGAGLHRTLLENLRRSLGSNCVCDSVWRRTEVQAELYVSVARFDSDTQGRVVLQAHWRILKPGGTGVWRAGDSSVVRAGPSPVGDPDGAVAALSAAWATFGGEMAAVLRDYR